VTSRVPPLDRQDIGADAIALLRSSFPRADRFFATSSAPPMPPVLGLLARHPAITGPWLGFSGALLDNGVLSARTRELLILATARRTGASYLWAEHVPMAAVVGLAPDDLAAIATGRPHDWSAADLALLQAVEDLVDRHRVGDDTWRLLAEQFEDQALLEVLFVVGAYGCLAMVLNSTGLVAEQEAP
jgi:alkylhydroperoxidase family enzyme